MISCAQTLWKNPSLLGSPFLQSFKIQPNREIRHFSSWKKGRIYKNRGVIVCGLLLPVDPWAPGIDSQSIASQLFAVSLFPYLGFLYFITKSKSAPKLTLFGFYFLLAFVGATIPWILGKSFELLYVVYVDTIGGFLSTLTILFFVGLCCFNPVNPVPAGIYAKVHYGTSLSNVDWLHGSAESLLTLTNLFIVLGLRKALREVNNAEESTSNVGSATKDKKNPLI